MNKENKLLPNQPNVVTLGCVLSYEQPTPYIVSSTKYDNNFRTPVLTAGKSFVLGYTNEANNIYPVEKLPVIIFDDFTTAIQYVDFPFKVKSSAMKILSLRDSSAADIKFIYNVMRNIKFDARTHKRYWIAEYSKITFSLPSLTEQKKVVSALDKRLAAIAKAKQAAEEQLADIKLLPTILLHQKFPTVAKNNKEYQHTTLGNICAVDKNVISSGAEKEKRLPYVGLENIESNSGNLINVSALTQPKSASFHFTDKHILYGKLRPYLNKVAVPDFEGICSSEAVPLLPNESKVDKMYLCYFIRQQRIANELMHHSTGSRQPRASLEYLLNMKILLPSPPKQRSIAAKLNRQLLAVESARQAAEQQLADINQLTNAIIRETITP